MKINNRIIDIFTFVVGPLITIISLLSWKMKYNRFFYYPAEAKVGIGVGIALICFGFLWRYWRKHEKKEGDK